VGVGGEGWRAVAEVVGMGELLLNAGAFEVVRWQDLFDQRVQKSGNVFKVVIGEYRCMRNLCRFFGICREPHQN